MKKKEDENHRWERKLCLHFSFFYFIFVERVKWKKDGRWRGEGIFLVFLKEIFSKIFIYGSFLFQDIRLFPSFIDERMQTFIQGAIRDYI